MFEGRASENKLVHPKYDQIYALLQSRSDLASKVNQIKDCAKDYRIKGGYQNDVDFQKLKKDDRILAIKEQMRRQFEIMMGFPDVKRELPKAPKSSEVYGRFEKDKLYDLGCGEMNKLAAPLTMGMRFVGVDKEQPKRPLNKVEFIKSTIEDLDLPKDAKVTSINALSNFSIDEVEKVKEYDGLHIYPDVKECLAAGFSTGTEDGAVTTVKGKTFKDRVVDLPSFKIKFGYSAASTFASRDVDFVTIGDWEEGDYAPKTYKKIVLAPILSDDVSPKMDGEFYEIETDNGVGFITRRNMSQRKVKTDFKGHVCLQLERMDDDSWYLLRIEIYNGFTPYHSGDIMRYFCSRVKIKIDGSRVLAPLKYKPGMDVKHDGIVYRYGQEDYFYKFTLTVDVDDTELFCEQAMDDGYFVEFVGVQSGLSEYKLVVKTMTNIVFEFVRLREDKDSADNWKSFKRMI